MGFFLISSYKNDWKIPQRTGDASQRQIFERGEMPPELYDRACRAAEQKGMTVGALFEEVINSAAEKLTA